MHRTRESEETMFPGMFMRKPDKAAALKQLKTHVAMFGAWVAVIRVTPYILHYLYGENEELKFEL
ncbi:Mitochondrial import receptor subunit [Trema orientale]|uniref:Mitochondrial import receptor subunit n=1 Tax=Trema orientale TaxID=63057 RepID=A0A2P5B7F6_TREOI|nr:Mitochondrial import receptor subunit [Trema orientale]